MALHNWKKKNFLILKNVLPMRSTMQMNVA